MLFIAFPLWALLISALALLFPSCFIEFKSWIIPLLMAVMLGMGMTLRWSDFLTVWHTRFVVGLGVAIQFLIMPFAAWFVSLLFNLSLELTIGMMLVGATAGGTASNVMTYLAKGDIALSVSMTLISTLIAVFMLPVLTWFYLGQSVQVPVVSMLITLIKIIVVPLLMGMVINAFFHKQLRYLLTFLPLFSMSAILLIIAIVVALNAQNFTSVAWTLVAAVMLHNLIGLLCGYGLTRKLGYNSVIARTVALEVGMQNSGLSVALALQYFSAASALPGAIFSIWHNLSGSLLASYWQRNTKKSLK